MYAMGFTFASLNKKQKGNIQHGDPLRPSWELANKKFFLLSPEVLAYSQ